MTQDAQNFPVPDSADSSHSDHHDPAYLQAAAGKVTADAQPAGHEHEASHRLQISTPEEILAYIQCTLGFRPTDSLVMIAFDHQALSTVIRCDLPEALQKTLQSNTLESVTFFDFGLTEPQELQLMDLGKKLGELMARESATTGCLLVYFADTLSVSDHHALAAAGTVNAMLTAQFGLAKIPVEESWLIHHQQLWHLRCTVTTECEVQGDAIGDPVLTDIFHTLDPQGNSRHPQQAMRKLAFPQTSNMSSKSPPDTQALLEQRPKVVLDWLSRWEQRLREGPTMLYSDHVAQLLAALEHPRLRDAVLAMACFDFTTALHGMVALGQLPDQMTVLAGVQGNIEDGLAVKDCLQGQSERAPDWQRIAALERLCHQLLPLSDLHSGGVVVGLLAWIEWVRGRGSIALGYVRQARKHFPTERFLLILEDVLRQGVVAGWTTRMDSAWSPGNAA